MSQIKNRRASEPPKDFVVVYNPELVSSEDIGPGRHIRLTRDGQDMMRAGQMVAQFIQAGGQQEEIMFGARHYRCDHCGTRYESLPNLKGAVKCRQCGSNDVKEEP